MEVIRSDCLIIGGGIQGLVLYQLLKEKGIRSLALVTDHKLGEGESIHTHGYYNRGYFNHYESTIQSKTWWDNFFNVHGKQCGEITQAYVLTQADEAKSLTQNWQQSLLPYQELVQANDDLSRLGFCLKPDHKMYSVAEGHIHGSAILKVLAAGNIHQFIHGRVRKLACSQDKKAISYVEIEAGNRKIKFIAKQFFLCAGRNNQRLIESLCNEKQLTNNFEKNNVRFVPMLLIKGPHPDLTGIYLPYYMTLASRTNEAGTMTTIMSYIKDLVSTRDTVSLEQSIKDDNHLVRLCLSQLKQLFPKLQLDSNQFQFAYFTGPKIDHPAGGKRNNDGYISNVGFDNLELIWPGLFTHSYYCAHSVMKQHESQAKSWLLQPSMEPFDATNLGLPTQDEVASEYPCSEKLNWFNWRDFCAIYTI